LVRGWSTVSLALGMSADVFVVVTKIVPSVMAAAFIASAVVALLIDSGTACPSWPGDEEAHRTPKLSESWPV
jgi:hypothetical protein